MMQITNTYLGTTRDGYSVYDRADSHFHSECGITNELLKKALRKIYANGIKFKKKEIHFPNTIGLSHCVETTSNDEVIMVYRKNRQGQTPMVINRKPEPSNTLTVIILKDTKHENRYILVSCFVGGGSMREPWDKGIMTDEERKQSEEFWSSHALLYNPTLIDWDRM